MVCSRWCSVLVLCAAALFCDIASEDTSRVFVWSHIVGGNSAHGPGRWVDIGDIHVTGRSR